MHLGKHGHMNVHFNWTKQKPQPFGWGFVFVLVQDVDHDTLVFPQTHGADQGADLFRDPALTANDSAHVLSGDAQLQGNGIAGFQHIHLNLFRDLTLVTAEKIMLVSTMTKKAEMVISCLKQTV